VPEKITDFMPKEIKALLIKKNNAATTSKKTKQVRDQRQ
jgi:hypothetical protein